MDAWIVAIGKAALTRMGKYLATSIQSRRDRVADAKAANIISEYDFSQSLLAKKVELPSGVTDNMVSRWMKSPEVDAMAFELLAVAMTGAEDAAYPRLRAQWRKFAADHGVSSNRFSDSLLDALFEHYAIVVELIKDASPATYARLREQANFQRIACVLEAIEARVDPYSSECPPVDVIAEFTQLYKRQCKQAHRFITPPDFDRRRSVPIEDLYVSPTISRYKRRGEPDSAISDLGGEVDRTVLLGDPGNGKSTASQVLAYRLAKEPDSRIPFLIVLRDFASNGIKMSVIEHIEATLRTVYQVEPPAGVVEYLVEHGGAFVIFDGLDELLDTSHRVKVTEAVSLFCNRFPTTRTLVTSRKVGYWQAPMDESQFEVLELSGFDDEQVRSYVTKWFAQEDLSAERAEDWTRSFLEESSQVRDLTATPLLLSLICIIYRGERSIPRNRPAVYERCATMLFDKWDSSRGIHAELQVGQLVDPAMKHLAYWLYAGDSADGVVESALVRETTSYLHERSFEDEHDARIAAQQFVEFCRGRAWVFSDAGTTPEGERLYKFTHRTFLEYFAAYHLSRTVDTPEALARKIAPRAARGEWDVVAQLAVQIADKHVDQGAIRIFDYLLNERRRRTLSKRAGVLGFLCRCLSFAQVSPAVVRQLTRQTANLVTANRTREHSAVVLEAFGQLLKNADLVGRPVIEDELSRFIQESIAEGDAEQVDIHAGSFAAGALVPSVE